MTSHSLNEGWALINGGYTDGSTTGMNLRFRKAFINIKDNVIKTNYAGDGRFELSIGEIDRKITLIDVQFENQNDAEQCIENLATLNDGGKYPIKLQTSDTPTYQKLDGTNTQWNVLYTDISQWTKESNGNQQIWIIKKIVFDQG